MDERNLPKAATGITGPGHPVQGAHPGAGSTFVFFGNPEQVRDGFVIALHAMGITATIADATRTSRPNRENDHA
jgi:hypothetical protein